MEPITAIDVSTSEHKVAVLNAQGHATVVTSHSSAGGFGANMFFSDTGVLFGQDADANCFKCPDRYVRKWKPKLGTDVVLATAANGEAVLARDCLELTLQRIVESVQVTTGHRVHQVVLTVPARSSQRAIDEMLSVCAKLGLKVIRIVKEPVAAAIADGLYLQPAAVVLAVDVGAGTTDVAVLEIHNTEIDVKVVDGLPDLGGSDIDSIIIDYALSQYANEHGHLPKLDDDPMAGLSLIQQAQTAKVVACRTGQASLLVVFSGKATRVDLTIDRLDELCKEWTSKIITLSKSARDASQAQGKTVERILLCGGAALMPSLREQMENSLGIPTKLAPDPLHAVVKGAVIAGRMELEQQGHTLVVDGVRLPPVKWRLTQVTSEDIGITTLTDDRQREVLSTVIPRGTRYPGKYRAAFQTAEIGQTSAEVEICLGRGGADRSECEVLGTIEMTDLPPVHDRLHPIDVVMEIDRHGVLTVVATDPVGGKVFPLQVEWRKPNAA